MKYTTKRLEQLADDDLIYPKNSEYYRNLLKETLKRKGWDYDTLIAPDGEADLHEDQLWYDCCKVINDLAQLVLDERQKTAEIIVDLKIELKNTLSGLTKISKK